MQAHSLPRRGFNLFCLLLLTFMLSFSISGVRGQQEILSPEEYFAEVSPGYIPLTDYNGGNAFLEENLTGFDDDSIGITLTIPDTNGDSVDVLFTVKGYDATEVLDYLNTVQVYFDTLELPEGAAIAWGEINWFDDLFLMAALQEMGSDEDLASLYARLEETYGGFCQQGEAVSLNQMLETELSDSVLDNALAFVQSQMDADVANQTESPEVMRDSARPEDFMVELRDDYSRILYEDACRLLLDDFTTDARPDGLTILMELPEDNIPRIVYYSIDPTLNRGQVQHYIARKIQHAESRAVASIGTIQWQMWRFKPATGLVTWSGSDQDSAGAPEPNWLRHSSAKAKWYDVSATAVVNGTTFTMQGGWTPG
jgi:hypothetical protein